MVGIIKCRLNCSSTSDLVLIHILLFIYFLFLKRVEAEIFTDTQNIAKNMSNPSKYLPLQRVLTDSVIGNERRVHPIKFPHINLPNSLNIVIVGGILMQFVMPILLT